MKLARKPNLKHLLIQVICIISVFSFFTYTTSNVSAQSDPFALTEEKTGLFQGLPDKFKGLFNSDSQLLNGFFQYVQQNLGGASAKQEITEPTYPPGEFPFIPVSADFIKVTSDWTASCTADNPPDELHASTCNDSVDGSCPWTPANPPPCPRAPGVGCCVGPCGCLEVCLPGPGQNGLFVTNHCTGTIGDVRVEGLTPSGGNACGPFNVGTGSTVNVCMEHGPYLSAHTTDGKVGSGSCLLSDPTQCCSQDLDTPCDI